MVRVLVLSAAALAAVGALVAVLLSSGVRFASDRWPTWMQDLNTPVRLRRVFVIAERRLVDFSGCSASLNRGSRSHFHGYRQGTKVIS